MNRIESDEASNDDTSIISELLNSAEAMQTSTVPTTDDSTLKEPLPQTHGSQIVQNTVGVSATFCDVTNQNVIVSLQQSQSLVGAGLLNSQYSDVDDLNKVHIRHVNIPYILNGELYQIQTQDGENVTVKCCHCPPDRVYRGSVRSTGNFHMHIKRRHPDLLEKLHDMKVNALLERRDRLMRNRKITHRNNRNRSTNAIVNSKDMCSFNNEENAELIQTTPISQMTLDSATESSFLHTHKLKIKTVFQRHQMQQREAAEMQNWKKTEYIVMPIGKLPTDVEPEQPINYSLKSKEIHETKQQEKRNPQNVGAQTPANNLKNLSTNIITEDNKFTSQNHTNKRNPSTSSISTSYSSVISNGSHEYESDRTYNSFTFQHHNLSIIKPEHLLLAAETEAIDLTMHTDSGILSNSEDNISENNNDNRVNKIGTATKESNIMNVTMVDAEGNSKSGTNSTKWQELLVKVENSLRDIQREMNVRNQIESNRMFLDIAKFKFLNPGFQFNW